MVKIFHGLFNIFIYRHGKIKYIVVSQLLKYKNELI